MPRYVIILQDIDRPGLQLEAAGVLTNVASATAQQTRVVVEHSALPIFVQLLQSPNDDVLEQVLVVHSSSARGHGHRIEGLQTGLLVPCRSWLLSRCFFVLSWVCLRDVRSGSGRPTYRGTD